MKFLHVLLLFCSLNLFGQNAYQKGVTLFNKEAFQSARPYFQEYLKQHPNHTRTIEYLGDIAGHTKDWDTAISYYSQLVEADDKNANYHFKYGGVLGMKALSVNKLRALTYIDDIKEHFEKAASLDPTHIETRWALVEYYIQLPGIVGGSERKAIMYAEELMQISTVDGYLALGYIAEYSDRPEDAEKYYRQAIEVGGSPHTYEKLTKLYEKNNKPKEAIATASKSLELHDRNALNYQIGKICAQYNMESDYGLRCLQTYIDNHSAKDGVPLDWAYYRIAQIYRNNGKKEKAMEWIDKALVSRPNFKEALKEKKAIQAL